MAVDCCRKGRTCNLKGRGLGLRNFCRLSRTSDNIGFFQGVLNIANITGEPRDTFLRLDGWTKVSESVFLLIEIFLLFFI